MAKSTVFQNVGGHTALGQKSHQGPNGNFKSPTGFYGKTDEEQKKKKKRKMYGSLNNLKDFEDILPVWKGGKKKVVPQKD